MEECISVFDMLKIGVGPSSSHTLGPWRAAERFLAEIRTEHLLTNAIRVKVDLYGSLSLTGKGHATDYAVMLGLSGQDPETIPVAAIDGIIQAIKTDKKIKLGNEIWIDFDVENDIVFNKNFLPFHANGLTFTIFTKEKTYSDTFYSIGGGFVVTERRSNAKHNQEIKCSFPYPIQKADELLAYCNSLNKSISEIVWENEKSMRSEEEI
ncbi:MAG TPA: serine dehydratase beta chain, partial [Flavobacterium sp.]|nr:serine dehydratase beta chain [Flavobacterium sp.]